MSQDYKIEQRILQGIPKKGELPCSNSFISVSPNENIHISALYKMKNSKNYILRIWNSSNESVDTKISSMFNFKSIKKISMDEENIIGEIEQKNDAWILSVGKSEIVTMLLEV